MVQNAAIRHATHFFFKTLRVNRRCNRANQTEVKINQLHAVSRTQQGRQREPSVKTHRPRFPPGSGGIVC